MTEEDVGQGQVQRTNVWKPRTSTRNRWHSLLTSDTSCFWIVEPILTNLESCNFLHGELLKGLIGPPSLDCRQTATANDFDKLTLAFFLLKSAFPGVCDLQKRGELETGRRAARLT